MKAEKNHLAEISREMISMACKLPGRAVVPEDKGSSGNIKRSLAGRWRGVLPLIPLSNSPATALCPAMGPPQKKDMDLLDSPVIGHHWKKPGSIPFRIDQH